MEKPLPMHASPRCRAHSRRSGKPVPSNENGICRMHSGKSTGAPKGNSNAWEHGICSAWGKARRALLKSLARLS